MPSTRNDRQAQARPPPDFASSMTARVLRRSRRVQQVASMYTAAAVPTRPARRPQRRSRRLRPDSSPSSARVGADQHKATGRCAVRRPTAQATEHRPGEVRARTPHENVMADGPTNPGARQGGETTAVCGRSRHKTSRPRLGDPRDLVAADEVMAPGSDSGTDVRASQWRRGRRSRARCTQHRSREWRGPGRRRAVHDNPSSDTSPDRTRDRGTRNRPDTANLRSL